MENRGYILKNRNWSTNDQIKKYHASHYKCVPKLAYVRRFDDTKRVTRPLMRRMTDNTTVKRVTRHLIRRMTDNTMVKRVARHQIRRMTDNTTVKRVTRHLIRRMTDNIMVKRKRTKQQPVTKWVFKRKMKIIVQLLSKDIGVNV